MGSALHGAFEMNIIQLIGLPIIALVSLIIYWALFRNMAKKEWTGKKSFFASFFRSHVRHALVFAVALSSMLFIEPLYVASPKMNIVIAIICALVFVVGAIWLTGQLARSLPSSHFVVWSTSLCSISHRFNEELDNGRRR